MDRFVVFGFDTRGQAAEFQNRLDAEGFCHLPCDGGWTPPGADAAVPQFSVAVTGSPGMTLRELGRAFRQSHAMAVNGSLATGYAARFWDLTTDVVDAPLQLVPCADRAAVSGWTRLAGVDWTAE